MSRLALASFVALVVACPATASAVQLYAAKTVSGDFTPGSTVTYTIIISHETLDSQPDNPGDEFRDDLPSGLTLLSALATSGTTVANGANQVSWNGAIPPNTTVTITIQAAITASAGTVIANQGYVAFDDDGDNTNEVIRLTDDPDTAAEDDATAFTVVEPCPPACGAEEDEVEVVEQVPTEEPIVEEPIVEEPVVEEPIVVEEPVVEEPVATEQDAVVEEASVVETSAEPVRESSDDGCSGGGAGLLSLLVLLARWPRR